MKGLILKDFINLKKNVKIFGALVILYGVMAFTSKDASFFGSIFTMLFAILTLSIYSYDEMAKWDVYALTMPISKDNVVQGKYIMMLLLTSIGAVFGTAFSVFLNIAMEAESMFEGVSVSVFGAVVAIIFYSITLPIITKLGVEKARLVFFAVYLIPVIIGYIANKAIKASGLPMPEKLITVIEFVVQYVYIIVPLVVVITLCISYTLSIRIYRNREF